MRILVTGGSGFIGGAFVRAASKAGHKVAVLSRRSAPSDSEALWLQGDLANPPWEAIHTFAPEACVHAAWIVTPGICMESPLNEDYLRDSKDFLLRLAASGVRQMVGLGTCIEYCSSPSPLVEDKSEIAPTTAYARSKNALRIVLEETLSGAGDCLAWARPFYVYGPGEPPNKLCSSLILGFRAGQAITLHTGASVKDYVHVTDVAEALLKIVESKFRGTINIGSGEGVAVEEIGKCVAQLMKRPELLRVEHSTFGDQFESMIANVEKLRSLGVEQSAPITDRIQNMIQDLNKHTSAQNPND